MESERVDITIDLAEVANKFLHQIKSNLDFVSLIYHAVADYETSLKKPLPTDNLPISVSDNSNLDLHELKKSSINWILEKAFEDIIKGITASFKEMYKYLQIQSFAKKPRGTYTKQDLDEFLKTIETDSEKFHVPHFIEKIELLLSKPLDYRDEILSINKVRNCLVHRHGIVGLKDVDPVNKELSLKWVYQECWYLKNGDRVKMTYKERVDGLVIDGLELKEVAMEKKFYIDDQVEISLEEFNGVSFTCILIANSFFKAMPKA